MYVIAIHSVSDPEAFWNARLELPQGTELAVVAPSTDGARGVCIFESDSVDTVRRLVDGAAGEISDNEFHAVNEANAEDCPSPAPRLMHDALGASMRSSAGWAWPAR